MSEPNSNENQIGGKPNTRLDTRQRAQSSTQLWIDETVDEVLHPTLVKSKPHRSKPKPMLDLRADIKRTYILWFPWALAAGIALYLEVLIDWPDLSLTWVKVAIPALFTLMFLVGPTPRKALVLVVGILLGILAVEHRVSKLPVLPERAPRGVFDLEAKILSQESKQGRVRLDVQTVEPVEFSDGQRRRKFRLWGRDHIDYRVGAHLQLKFKLRSVPRPTHLQAYNPRWHAFFGGTAAYGLVYGYPKPAALDLEQVRPTRARIRWFFARVRDRVSIRLEDLLHDGNQGLAQALLTGQRSQVLTEQTEDLRASGLSHLLAISGLHISLVFGFVFLLLRSFVPLFGRLALSGRVRDIALGVAFTAALAYMLLAGSPLPTIRAVTMTGLLALAIFLRRQPFSLNALALAASIILLLWPESMFGPSFLLSFSVVLALIAFARITQRRLMRARDRREKFGWLRTAMHPFKRYLVGIIATSLIATFVSMPISLYFFQEHSLVGIIANIVAVPLAAFWIMPTGVLSLLLMPFGLDAPFVWLMGLGIDTLVAWSHLTASWDKLHLWTPPMHPLAVIAYLVGLAIICFHRSRIKYAACVCWVMAVLVGFTAQTPDIVVGNQPLEIGLVQQGNVEPVLLAREDSFTHGRWQGAFVPTEGSLFRKRASLATSHCGFEGCIIDVATSTRAGASRIRIALANSQSATRRDCRDADVLITTERLTERLREIYGCRKNLVLYELKNIRAEAPLSLWLSGPDALTGAGPIRLKSYAGRMESRPWR